MRVATIPATVHGRYLTTGDEPSRVLVGFHGYGEAADDQLQRIAGIPGSSEAWTLVSIQGLHRFYERRTNRIVASWMTRQDRELAIADNIAYVLNVVDKVLCGRQPESLVCAGFSQGVAMAFRAAVSLSGPSRHVIAVGGDVPPELGEDALRRVSSVLICRGTDDPFYTRDSFDADVRRLRAAGVSVDGRAVRGQHQWSEDVSAAAGQFLRRCLSSPEDP